MKVSSLGWVGWGWVEVLTTLPLNFPWQVLITQTRYCEDDRGAFELSLAERYELDLIYCHLSMLSSTAVPFSYTWQNIAQTKSSYKGGCSCQKAARSSLLYGRHD